MDKEAVITTVTGWIDEWLADQPSLFLVEVKIKPTNNIKVFLDGDDGVTIEKCTRLNRHLYKLVEEQQLFPADDFSMEVSSAGVGEPLLLIRQYHKNIGRFLAVKLSDDTLLEGELKEVTEDGIVLTVTTGKGKKLMVNNHSILFESIKKAAVEVKF